MWLDAGAGRTTFYPWRVKDGETLKKSGAEMFGCDLDLDALRDRNDGARVCVADLDHLPYRDGTFDFVVSNMVFEHLDTPERAVAELIRVTRPDGRVLVHTVNALHMTALLARATPHSFHEWINRVVEGRPTEDTYPTRYRANTVGVLERLFADVGWEPAWGGLVSSHPYFVPYRGLFWLGFGAGLLEIKLSSLGPLAKLLKPNILMEFRRK